MVLAAGKVPLSDYIFINFESDVTRKMAAAGSLQRQLLADDSPAVHLHWASGATADDARVEEKFWRQLRKALLGNDVTCAAITSVL